MPGVDADSFTVQQYAVVDALRDLWTQLGARSYAVILVHTRWSGGAIGEGQEQIIDEKYILPVPKVSTATSLTHEASPIGTEDSGELTISEISPRYTENVLLGLGQDGTPLAEGTQFYYEILNLDGTAPENNRRRFITASAPNYDPEAFEWTVRLTRVIGDRTRSGAPG
jgi:hypothetical protein